MLMNSRGGSPLKMGDNSYGSSGTSTWEISTLFPGLMVFDKEKVLQLTTHLSLKGHLVKHVPGG